MNHSARAKFEPTAVLTAWATLTTTDKTADVKFKAGFNEWEEARTKSNLNVLLEHFRKHSFHKVDKV